MSLPSSIRVLLVEDNPGDARLIQETLNEMPGATFSVERVDTLRAALDRLGDESADIAVVLLDLSLPDSQGLESFRSLYAREPRVPIVVLSGNQDEAVGIAAVNEGAQDYLVKGRAGAELIGRSIRYAIERHRTLEQVRQLAIHDPLTGLANRRGFMMLAEHHLAVASRQRRPLALVFADMDRMKAINDVFGHAEGDRALIDAAHLLRETFRQSDVLARLGGDEFTVLLTDVFEEGVAVALERLEANIASFNATRGRPYALGLSTGVAYWDPSMPLTLERLLVRADQEMYRDKRSTKSA